MPFFADSCVMLDVFTNDVLGFEWSSAAISSALNRDRVIINAVVYAEISVRFNDIAQLERMLPGALFELQAIPREAAFLAGKAFAKYRKRGGIKSSPLPDFLIGAHASVLGVPLITRDPRRFRQYYPRLVLICP